MSLPLRLSASTTPYNDDWILLKVTILVDNSLSGILLMAGH
jgi:hypothetical protein